MPRWYNRRMTDSLPPTPPPQPEPTAAPPVAAPPPKPAASTLTPNQQRGLVIVTVTVFLALTALAAWAAIYLVQNPATAATVRDVFIIFMALEALVIGVALVVLTVQVAALTNLLRHELTPILLSLQDTINTVRGTTLFVSENVTEPIIKLNSYVAALSSILETIGSVGGLFRRS